MPSPLGRDGAAAVAHLMSDPRATVGTRTQRFRVERILGSGSFGEVYAGREVSSGTPVAIKLESRHASVPQLQFEARIYQRLGEMRAAGFARAWAFFTIGKHLRALVIDMKGPSVGDLLERCSGKVTLKTALEFGRAALTCIRNLHASGNIHRDIKPDNFLVGADGRGVFLVDFGLSKRFCDGAGVHIKYREDKRLTGTPRFATISNHLGIEQSRRDDVECLLMVLISMLKGSLPWEGMRHHQPRVAGGGGGKAAARKQWYDAIMMHKMATSVAQLCDGLHPNFEKAYVKCRILTFPQEPPYDEIDALLRGVARDSGIELDGSMEWDAGDADGHDKAADVLV